MLVLIIRYRLDRYLKKSWEKPKVLFLYNLLQFLDYSKYEFYKFSQADREEEKSSHFLIDYRVAYDIGREITKVSMK